MSLVDGWHYINQLNAPVSESDGVDENKNQNCVAADISMCLWSLTGTEYQPDQVKDDVYGENYTGPQSAAAYVKYCADRGMTLAPYNAPSWQLIEEMKKATAALKPCVFTVPTQWQANIDTGSTHVMVCLAYDGATDTFDIADPWGGVARKLTGSFLTPRLRYNQIWEAGSSVAAVIVALRQQVATLTAQLTAANARIAAAQKALGG